MKLKGTNKHPLALATLFLSQAWSQANHHQAHRRRRSHLLQNFVIVDMLKTASRGESGLLLTSVSLNGFAIMAS